MQVLRPADARSFLDLAGPLLLRDEARHNLILGIAGTMAQNPDAYPEYHTWVVLDGEEVVAAGSMTPPYHLVVADPATETAADALLEAVRASGLEVPGVVANLPTAPRFAHAWSEATGAVAELVRSEGVYALTEVLDIPPAPGDFRPATPADRALLERWLMEFAAEALPGEESDGERLQRSIETRFSSGAAGLWFWEDDDVPVSLAGYSGPTTSGIRIGPGLHAAGSPAARVRLEPRRRAQPVAPRGRVPGLLLVHRPREPDVEQDLRRDRLRAGVRRGRVLVQARLIGSFWSVWGG